MKLNFDCIRDILLYCETKSSIGNFIYFNNGEFPEELNKYSNEEVKYHIRQLDWEGLITKPTYHSDGLFFADLTPAGHRFIGEIRSNTNWEKTKSVAKQAGVFTFAAIKEIAVNVASAAISNVLGSHNP